MQNPTGKHAYINTISIYQYTGVQEYSPRGMSCTSSCRRVSSQPGRKRILLRVWLFKLGRKTKGKEKKNNVKLADSGNTRVTAVCSTAQWKALRESRIKRSSYSVAHTDRTSGCRVGFITFPRRRVVSGPEPLSHTRHHRRQYHHRRRIMSFNTAPAESPADRRPATPRSRNHDETCPRGRLRKSAYIAVLYCIIYTIHGWYNLVTRSHF